MVLENKIHLFRFKILLWINVVQAKSCLSYFLQKILEQNHTQTLKVSMPNVHFPVDTIFVHHKRLWNQPQTCSSSFYIVHTQLGTGILCYVLELMNLPRKNCYYINNYHYPYLSQNKL